MAKMRCWKRLPCRQGTNHWVRLDLVLSMAEGLVKVLFCCWFGQNNWGNVSPQAPYTVPNSLSGCEFWLCSCNVVSLISRCAKFGPDEATSRPTSCLVWKGFQKGSLKTNRALFRQCLLIGEVHGQVILPFEILILDNRHSPFLKPLLTWST